LVGIGDGQTIFQEGIFEKHIFYSANLKSEESSKHQAYNAEQIKNALLSAIQNSGPVHINVPFNEPLYETEESSKIAVPEYIASGVNEIQSDSQIKRFRDLWYGAKRKMILVGVLPPNSFDESLLKKLAEDKSLVVFTETTSNLSSESFFPSIDKIIAPLDHQGFEDLQPEFLLTFGGMVISKKIKAFLRKYQPKEHWHIGPLGANDTFFALTEHVKSKPNSFLKKAFNGSRNLPDSNYQNLWLKVKRHREKGHENYMNVIPFSDLLAFYLMLNYFPKYVKVQMGNSSAIRYAQLFNWHPSIQMFCNRGTSGIDGSTSTAIGAAVVSEKPTIFVTGDLSFFYDSNALWNNYIPNNFKIILINNGGGGIFRILPGHKNTENFDRYFETKHHLIAKQLCEMYGFNYITAMDRTELEVALSLFFENNDQPILLEIFTPSRMNDEILLQYFEHIK
ncbi:MAG: thiamine pyrophosphate-dependent enzyme, partial [Bacteroidota bacterium]